MSESFEEFLKRKKHTLDFRGSEQLDRSAIDIPFPDDYPFVDVVTKQALGEWAWEEFERECLRENDVCDCSLDDSFFFEVNDCGYSIKEILGYLIKPGVLGNRDFEQAVACLGKEEIEKRLRDLVKEKGGGV